MSQEFRGRYGELSWTSVRWGCAFLVLALVGVFSTATEEAAAPGESFCSTSNAVFKPSSLIHGHALWHHAPCFLHN
jgi:hypothetical protein